MKERKAVVERKTLETDITLELNVDGSGDADVKTGIGFFDHMLTTLAKHALLDLRLRATGDLHVDPHHLVEDVGVCLGKALAEAIGDKQGIQRFGSVVVPMDEALILAAIDLSGRGYLGWEVLLGTGKVGDFDVELAEEFFKALAFNGKMNLHLRQLSGTNRHHAIEAAFKATALALREATALNPRIKTVPSTKGRLR